MINIQKIKNFDQFNIIIRKEFSNLKTEKGVILFFDDDLRFIHREEMLISERKNNENSINLIELKNMVEKSKEKNIVYIHNHFNNNPCFSKNDVDNYYILKHFEKKLGYNLLDALITDKNCNNIISLEESHEIDLEKYPLKLKIKQYYLDNDGDTKITATCSNYWGLDFSKFHEEFNIKNIEEFKKNIFDNFGDMDIHIKYVNINEEEEIWKN